MVRVQLCREVEEWFGELAVFTGNACVFLEVVAPRYPKIDSLRLSELHWPRWLELEERGRELRAQVQRSDCVWRTSCGCVRRLRVGRRVLGRLAKLRGPDSVALAEVRARMGL